MSKTKVFYTCSQCGYQSAKWLGKCPECNQWNTLVEEVSLPENKLLKSRGQNSESPVSISKVSIKKEARISSDISEFDNVIGGGLVKDSVVLIGGSPGIGKSTLLMQISQQYAQKNKKVLYVSAEESINQAKLRAHRLGSESQNIFIVNQTNVEVIVEFLNKINFDIVIVDSIQSLYRAEINSIPGSVSQVRECAGELTYLAKNKGFSLFLVGHITKGGNLAGPKILEHMVDAVLYFEGEQHQNYRILRGIKNRFGSTNEVAIFEMSQRGLKEIKNPSNVFISQRADNISGSVVVPVIEGSRPIMVEIQSLVSYSGYAQATRRVTGLDYNKVNLLIAVLEKRAKLKLANKDIFVNVAGGVKITEPASDLAVTIAIASSLKDIKLPSDLCVFGEVGLAGEVRAVSLAEKRVQEASKLGFKRCIIPKAHSKLLGKKNKMNIISVSSIFEALKAIK
jgi:DNA repair protein RadA/Sms